MLNPRIILLCMAAIALCSCHSKPKPQPTEASASQEQVTHPIAQTPPSCGNAVCSDNEICKENHCVTIEPSVTPPDHDQNAKAVNVQIQEPDDDHPKCGETICQFAEVCEDNQCKTVFEMERLKIEVHLAPIPKSGIVKNDNYDYWECQSETCTYDDEDKVYTIPKGIRIRESNAYCGGEGIALSQMKDYTCTINGWVCSSPNGCDKCEAGCRWTNTCTEVTCSPGEKCDYLNETCKYAGDVLEHVFLCENGDCECGTQRCGKNQICAYGNCYFAGEKRNGFGDCEFTKFFQSCGTSDPELQHIRYFCPKRCVSEIPPSKKEGYQYETFDIGGCPDIAIHLWTCQNEEGCECGGTPCPKKASCIDGQCVILTEDGYVSEDLLNTSYYDASTCASDYPKIFSYQPKNAAHYRIAQRQSIFETRYWECDESNACLCHGEKLPPNLICHRESNGSEFFTGIAKYSFNDSYFRRAPKILTNYVFKNDQWFCQNDACLCGDKPLPKNAYCLDDKIYCYNHEFLDNITGYACSETEKTWVCEGEKCLCGGLELRPGVRCAHLDQDYQCCGLYCFTSLTASEHDCIDSTWVKKADVTQSHCRNQLLPPGTRCDSLVRPDYLYFNGEHAVCGDDILLNWENYRCENGQWKCALKDKPCVCNGKPLPDGATCMDKKAYCGNHRLDQWDGLSCHDGKWVNDAGIEIKDTENDAEIENQVSEIANNTESGLCFGHKLPEGVNCPNYDGRFASLIEMFDMESCEDVRGCLCHEQLCPPSGICTNHGCIDPLTNKPFENKDGYLISDALRQCSLQQGCACGGKTIEFRDYCYHDIPYISLKSCVSNNKRMIGENNYTLYDCEEGGVPWKNVCYPIDEIDPSQYLVRDCLTSDQAFYSDRSYFHTPLNVCIQKDGCQCIHNKCKTGEACYKGQCVAKFRCYNLDDSYGYESENELGKCRPEITEDQSATIHSLTSFRKELGNHSHIVPNNYINDRPYTTHSTISLSPI